MTVSGSVKYVVFLPRRWHVDFASLLAGASDFDQNLVKIK
jgi:hypothetical protein